jgi:hypothetical protein
MVLVPDVEKELWGDPDCPFLTVLVEHSFYQDSIHESR